MRQNLAVAFALVSFCASATASEFKGELKLLPEGCRETPSRICHLGSMLTFKSADGLVWQTDIWKDGNGESGTTEGASIPKWAQPIIGDAYDESYLKAAIVHDHYCYKENHVRTWRQTHRMFYDALRDLGIDKAKAKTMYFAVYAFGPHWVKLVPGQNCGQNCIKSVLPSGEKKDDDTFLRASSQAEIAKFNRLVTADTDMSLAEIEAYAKSANPDDFYLNHGDSYVPNGKNDPNLLQMY